MATSGKKNDIFKQTYKKHLYITMVTTGKKKSYLNRHIRNI